MTHSLMALAAELAQAGYPIPEAHLQACLDHAGLHLTGGERALVEAHLANHARLAEEVGAELQRGAR